MVSSTSKYQRFLVTYRSRQNWTMPDSLIYYITKNPLSPKVYQKLTQTCKHFFIKNSIIVVEHLIFSTDDKIAVRSYPRRRYIDLENFANKIWAIKSLNSFNGCPPSYSVSSLVPKLYQCEVKYLFLWKQILTFDEFVLIASNVKKIELVCTIVKNNDDSNVPFEKLVKELTKIEEISFSSYRYTEHEFTTNTVTELLKIPSFSNLENFNLSEITETFDITTFFNYIKKNKTTKIFLSFVNSIPEAYKNQLENCVDEILAAQDEFKCPLIGFPGISREKYSKMKSLFLL